MPNDFHRELQITNGQIVPAGPLELEPDENVTSIFAWVIQTNHDGTAAMCAGFQDHFPDREGWSAKPGPTHHGQFREGQALGVAVMVSSSGSHYGLGGSPNQPRVYWWSENVILKEA